MSYIPEERMEEARMLLWGKGGLKAVARRLNELTEALKFYADDDNWIGDRDTCVSEVWMDHGDIAREALL